MKNLINGFMLFSVMASILFMLSSCAGGQHIRTKSIKNAEQITGIFTLILYGASYLDDIETIAILDLEGDGYEFLPFTPEYNFKTIKGVKDREAFEKALHHVSFHHNYRHTRIKKIIDRGGTTIGYELRPLYQEFTYGFSDLLRVYYTLLQNGRIKVNVELNPLMEKPRLLDRPGHKREVY
jgi:hypothetical protein